LKVAKALGAERIGKVNFPHYYTPLNMGKLINLMKKHSFDAAMVKKVLGVIGAIWLNEINRPKRLSFAELVLPVLKQGMSNMAFLKAIQNHYGKKMKRKKR
jgi:hypothetical protein